MNEVATSIITCAGGMPAFVATPPADAGTNDRTNARTPVVIVMHERYGLVRHTRDLVVRFARDGYLAIAPDFFFKHPDQDALHRGDSSCEMSDDEAAARLTVAIDALASIRQADSGRIAVMGVCQTGRHPLLIAASRPIAAALVWYGAAQPREWAVNDKYPRPLEDIIAAVGAPVLGMFGETDHLISIDDVRRFRDCLERHGKSYRIHVYRDAPHGWLNETMPGRYRGAQAQAAWAVASAFLKQALAPDYDRSIITQHYQAELGADYDFSRNVRLE
jgi:carboxymethylenebutenolidase